MLPFLPGQRAKCRGQCLASSAAVLGELTTMEAAQLSVRQQVALMTLETLCLSLDTGVLV